MDVLSLAMTFAAMYALEDYSLPVASVNWTAVNKTTWWGPADQEANQDITVYPASIVWEDEMIEDLRARLRRNLTYVPPLEDSNFEYGFNRDQLNNWTTYWAEEYDFKARETYMNQYPMYKTNIQGIDVFFIRVTPDVPDGVELVPFLMMHGFLESPSTFFNAIPNITAVSDDRNFAVEMIIPCLPGFGHSSKAVRKGMGAAQVAIVMRNLMLRLGFSKYYIGGCDFGSMTAEQLATLFPDEVLGFYQPWTRVFTTTAVLLQMVGQLFPAFIVEPDLYSRMYPLETIFTSIMTSTGYMHLQATKPDTIGVAVTDSPIGLLTYMLELIARFYNPTFVALSDGGIYNIFSQEDTIDELMWYWAPQSTVSAMRLYSESINKEQFGLGLENVQTPVPTWVMAPQYEVTYQPPLIVSMKYKNVLNITVLDYGGHFFVAEYPDVFSESVVTAITAFREWHQENDDSEDSA